MICRWIHNSMIVSCSHTVAGCKACKAHFVYASHALLQMSARKNTRISWKNKKHCVWILSVCTVEAGKAWKVCLIILNETSGGWTPVPVRDRTGERRWRRESSGEMETGLWRGDKWSQECLGHTRRGHLQALLQKSLSYYHHLPKTENFVSLSLSYSCHASFQSTLPFCPCQNSVVLFPSQDIPASWI